MAYCDGPTLEEIVAAVASRLNDPLYVRWTEPEIARAVAESLRTWSVWTSAWKARTTIDLPLATAFVDLSSSLVDLRPATLTNWDLVTDVQYALLEPPAPGGTWTGTAQFSLVQISEAIARRRDQFLADTGIVQTRTVTSLPAVGSGRYALPSCLLQIRRATWTPAATAITLPLRRTEEWGANTYQTRWRAAGTPTAYATGATPTADIQILPPPAGSGTLDLIGVHAGEPIAASLATPLGIPDDYVWVVKYGVLADLLSHDGLAIDMARCAYCESRWNQGIELARRQAVVLSAAMLRTVAGVTTTSTCRLGSLADADAYSPLWQLSVGSPRTLLLTGQNLLGVWPPAGGSSTWQAEVDLVRCAPIPGIPDATVDLPRDLLDTIVDLAQVVCLFKEGPGQLELALPLLERAAKSAGTDLALQQASVPARLPLHSQQQQDTRTSPRSLPALPVEVA